MGQLPVPVTPGPCEAAKCSPGDKAPLPVTPLLQLTLIINNWFKLNVLLKQIRKKTREV